MARYRSYFLAVTLLAQWAGGPFAGEAMAGDIWSHLGFADPVTRAIRQGPAEADGAVILMPSPFARGALQDDIVGQLGAARYTLDPKRRASLQHLMPIPDASRVYEKQVAAYPCQDRYTVVVSFDAAHHLTEAWGLRESVACT